MPISPKDLRQTVAQRELQVRNRVISLENAIDMMLRQKTPKPGETVQYKLHMEEPIEVIERVIEDYQRAGWEVTRWQGSQTDACNDLRFKYS
ncbi:hypothetical protein HYV85_04135 [Candidatus Woesearchaeota archaeon]|nr:hypothetical protein [Candidatus Woesearchaeota archaeon]